ncbi:glycosyltransferase family 10 domain-containing protein [Zunongwangia sp. HGR-M22]|uniref:glycosyltransferase family 10 domain-containing protein n=1 Tax=Zunongwangia sp. HGR-M22 TaxID=3015168 RepID=UPI0022DD0511|nr:glycosyltransferase family 10 [Zunongwangia sp. HGR-M22]WBL24859.1 glycosyltransferase family 10 [Zunongwangia sp. HGR-M22]
MIKIFKASKMSYTPFDNFEEGDLEFFQSNNVEIVDNHKSADIIVSDNITHLKKFYKRYFFGVKFLLWTNEPRFDLAFADVIKHFGFIKVHHMNIYTKNVFVQNLSFHGKMMKNSLKFLEKDFSLENRRIAALMSYYKGINTPALMFENKNIDLISLRSEIVLAGNRLDVLDVYGKDWPDNIAIENSRQGNWGTRKQEILNDYNFNLCFENTAYPNYMTEKIWNSIENYCLPIYYAKNTNAYSLFPKKSFIDYSEFQSPEDLFLYIKSMENDEFIFRMNRCLEVYNSICEKGKEFGLQLRQEVLTKIVEKIHSIKAS